MSVNYALYTELASHLPPERMQRLADGVQPEQVHTDRVKSFIYRWPDLTITVNETVPSLLAGQKTGFEGYVRRGIFGGTVPQRALPIVDRIRRITMEVCVLIQPSLDADGRAEELVGRLCGGLKPMMLSPDGAIYDYDSTLIVAPNGFMP